MTEINKIKQSIKDALNDEDKYSAVIVHYMPNDLLDIWAHGDNNKKRKVLELYLKLLDYALLELLDEYIQSMPTEVAQKKRMEEDMVTLMEELELS